MDTDHDTGASTLVVLTLNCALLDVRWLGLTLHCPAPWVDARLEKLIEILHGHPANLVCLQECFHDRHRKRLCEALAGQYPYHSNRIQQRWLPGLDNDLLVLSRWSLGDLKTHRFKSATPEERIFTRLGYQTMTVNISGEQSLQLVNAHLSAGGWRRHPESMTMEQVRAEQIRQVLTRYDPQQSTLLTGDFNAGPETSVDNYQLLIDTGFSDCLNMTDNPCHTWDPQNPVVSTGPENHLPPQRIDHVFLNPAAGRWLTPVNARVTMDERFTFNDSPRLCLSDHYAVEVTFRMEN